VDAEAKRDEGDKKQGSCDELIPRKWLDQPKSHIEQEQS
jgi:hypothetical protein